MLWGGHTTLAVDPTSEGFCFAVLQGSETLLDWGCREVLSRKPEEWRRKLGKLIGRYCPELIVFEQMKQSRRGPWARTFTDDLELWAMEHGISIAQVSRSEVQEAFAASGSTKYEIAVAIARMFPELEPRLPRQRKPWMSEDERMSIFDAVSFALVALGHRDFESV